jgi:hypothetical protein
MPGYVIMSPASGVARWLASLIFRREAIGAQDDRDQQRLGRRRNSLATGTWVVLIGARSEAAAATSRCITAETKGRRHARERQAAPRNGRQEIRLRRNMASFGLGGEAHHAPDHETHSEISGHDGG